jgi:hypothetical protein
MQESNHPDDSSSRWKPLLLPALVMVVGLCIGLVLFMIVWRVPALRAEATAFVLSIPKPVWFFIVLLIIVAAAAGVWYLIKPYVSDAEEREQSPHERSYPPILTSSVSQQESTSRATPAHRGAIAAPGHAITPTTPIPETIPGIELLLQRQGIEQENAAGAVERRAPSSESVPVIASQEVRTRAVKPETIISITLLKEVTLTIHIPGGRGTRQVPINAGTKRAQLLAYLAARRGELVHRSKILYHIFAWRREDGTADDEAMGGHFHSHAKLLRGNIKDVVLKINEEAGEQLIDPDIDPFTSNNEHWGISPICEVVDIEEVERQHKAIELARKDGLLTDEIPLFVKEACERLIAAYPGDFIEDLIKKSPKDFKPWEGRASWAKRYNTHFRSCFLNAKWLLGVFEEQQAQQCSLLREIVLKDAANSPQIRARLHQFLGADTGTAIERRAEGDMTTWREHVLEELEHQQRMYYGRAIEPFKSYALYACSTPYYAGNTFDEKISYNSTTERFGDRVTASEQALRRCLKACAFIGNTREAGEVYSTYEAQMTSLFKAWGLVWGPSQETQEEWESVRALTDAHRFSAQITTKQAG